MTCAWLLEGRSLVVALDTGAAVELVSDRGVGLGRFEGPLAGDVRARLAGAPLSPLLTHLADRSPGLAAALASPARRLDPPALLAGRRWRQLFVELTAACNERCLHCYADAGPERREALDRATAEAVVREAAALGFEVVQLTGGEALLVPFVADLVRLARSLGVPVVELYTNGLLLDEARLAELCAAGASFAFSLYGRDPAVHDAVTRVPGSQRRTLDALRRALAAGASVRVGVVATRPGDEAEALAAVELAVELGVPAEQVALEVTRGVGRGRFAGRELEPAAGTARGGHGPVRDRSARDRSARDRSARDRSAREPESGPGGKAAVLPDGRVVPCIFSRALVLGRVGPEGGLARALAHPAAALADLDADQLARRLAEGVAAQTCAECRVRTALLVGTVLLVGA